MYKCILHATDLSDNHYSICETAVKFAKKLHSVIHFIHVIEPPTSLQLAQSLGFAELATPSVQAVQAVMKVVGENLGLPDAHLHVEVGSAYKHIVDTALRLGCGLIILGSHAPSGLPLFLGSTAHNIMHHAPCDVLTLRSTDIL